MFILIAKAFAKEGNKEKYRELAAELVEKTRKESGNISYRLLEGTDNPNMVTFVEEWKDRAAMELHMQSEHASRILPQLWALQDGDSPPDFYEVML